MALVIDPNYADALAAIITIKLQKAFENLTKDDIEDMEDLLRSYKKIKKSRYNKEIKETIKEMTQNCDNNPE